MMHPLIENVHRTVLQHRLFERGDAVVIGLSGGADSVALLHALLTLKEPLQLSTIHAAHLHHGLRGASADRDEAFVRALCHALSVPLTVVHADVAKEAKLHSETVEEAGRRLRYALFDTVAETIEGQVKIAVAHHADDQAETVLFHVIRGTGIKGLRGIPIKRANIVRPLMECSAVSIRQFCREQQLSFMIDETNDQLDYTRNRIRHTLLPEMKKINSGVVDHLCCLSQIATEEDAFLEDLAAQLIDRAALAVGYCLKTLRAAPDVICKRALMQLVLSRIGVAPDHAQTEALLRTVKEGGRFGGLPHRWIAVCEHGVLLFIHESEQTEVTDNLPIPVSLDTPTDYHNTTIRTKRISYDEFLEKSKIHKNFVHYCVSYDMIRGNLYVRSRQSGDRIHPMSQKEGKSLKKLFNEHKIPTPLRSHLPILCDDEGVVAVPGVAVDIRAAVTPTTKHIVVFEYDHSKSV